MKKITLFIIVIFVFGLMSGLSFAQKAATKVKITPKIETAPKIKTLPKTKTVAQIKKFRIPDAFINLEISKLKPYRVTHLRILPLPADRPVVHPFLDLYQEDRRFSDLFSNSGKSMICGPTSLANVLIYLKYNHTPRYEKILKDHAPGFTNHEDWVRYLFNLCNTDRAEGTGIDDLENAAKEAIDEGGYLTGNIFIRGEYASIDNQRIAIGPQDLRTFSSSSPDTDRGVVLLFGWYSKVKEDGVDKFKRNGGHYVVLAGYDQNNNHVFYVTNPLVDYSSVYPIRYSKITLKRLPGDV
jgi:hypothetical protein